MGKTADRHTSEQFIAFLTDLVGNQPKGKEIHVIVVDKPLSDEERSRNRTKSKVRAKVEHVMLVIKRIFGFSKVRYRGLAKNTNWLFVTCGLTNLYVARRHVLTVT